jgi:hypothetical protein
LHERDCLIERQDVLLLVAHDFCGGEDSIAEVEAANNLDNDVNKRVDNQPVVNVEAKEKTHEE